MKTAKEWLAFLTWASHVMHDSGLELSVLKRMIVSGIEKQLDKDYEERVRRFEDNLMEENRRDEEEE